MPAEGPQGIGPLYVSYPQFASQNCKFPIYQWKSSPPPPTSKANVGPHWGKLPLCSVSSQRPLRASSAPSALSPLFLRLQKPKRHSRNCAATCFPLSARCYLLSPRPQNPTSQKSPSDAANSNPNSHPLRPSCPRQINVASAVFPLIPFTTRSLCPIVSPCSTMARQPFGLTSTVYPLARSVFPPSSHSTINSTLEFSRSPARLCACCDSSANRSILATVVSLRSTPLAIQPRCSAQLQIQANKHTLLCYPTYPPLPPPSMELPLPFYQPVTLTLSLIPPSQPCHPDRRAAPFAARSGGTVARFKPSNQFGWHLPFRPFFLYLFTSSPVH